MMPFRVMAVTTLFTTNAYTYPCQLSVDPRICQNTSGLVSPFLILCSNVMYALILTYPLVIPLLMINLTNYKLALSLLLPNYPPSLPILMTPLS